MWLTVGASIGGTDSKGAIEHSSEEYEAIARIAGGVLPFFPDEIITGVTGACE